MWHPSTLLYVEAFYHRVYRSDCSISFENLYCKTIYDIIPKFSVRRFFAQKFSAKTTWKCQKLFRRQLLNFIGNITICMSALLMESIKKFVFWILTVLKNSSIFWHSFGRKNSGSNNKTFFRDLSTSFDNFGDLKFDKKCSNGPFYVSIGIQGCRWPCLKVLTAEDFSTSRTAKKLQKRCIFKWQMILLLFSALKFPRFSANAV